jgi:membrane protease YdiL (CAAX protease family)
MEELAALVEALLMILLVGGLSLLAQWGRKNQGAQISLIVILLFVSFLVTAVGALVAIVGWSNTVSSDVSPGLAVGSALTLVLAGLAGLTLCIPPLRKITGDFKTVGYEGFTPTESSPIEEKPFEGWWSDPPVFFALWMFVNTLAFSILFLLGFALEPEAVGSALSSTGRLSFFTVFVGQLPFVVIALCGVGLGVQRNFRETFARLGYGPITLPQLGIVALFIVGALLLSYAADTLFATLQPELYDRVGQVSEVLFSPEGLSPVSAILFALLIGVGAGVGEETLFRGALQPRLGITLTSVLWASVHVQYGPSILLIYIFILSVGLGILRRHVNTTATFLTHAGYNSLGVLLAYFFGI